MGWRFREGGLTSPGPAKPEGTVRYRAIEIDDALSISEQVELWTERHGPPQRRDATDRTDLGAMCPLRVLAGEPGTLRARLDSGHSCRDFSTCCADDGPRAISRRP